MTSFNADMREFNRLVESINDPAILARPARHLLTQSVLVVEGEVKENMPVFTGMARQSVTHAVDVAFLPLWARVGSNLEYMPALEAGSRPHWPPPGALQPWAVRHGFPPGAKGDWLVRWAIAQRGTKARRMFRTGLAESQPSLERLLREAAQALGENLKGKV